MSTEHTPLRRERTVRAALWLPGLLVAVGAAVATAHGLFEVARAAAAPPLIAALYPLITDGLALVAYAATARLGGSGRRYAWTVVVLAAGLSGLAQASYLAHGVASASSALRFGVGAWPAIAAAVVAHLLYLIADANRTAPSGVAAPSEKVDTSEAGEGERTPATGQPTEPEEPTAPVANATFEPDEQPTVQLPTVQPGVHRTAPDAVQPDAEPVDVQPNVGQRDTVQPDGSGVPAPEAVVAEESVRSVESVAERSAASPARDRAAAAARTHRTQQGELPTVATLMDLADVSRGTAGEVLKTLRSQPAALHVVHDDADAEAHS